MNERRAAPFRDFAFAFLLQDFIFICWLFIECEGLPLMRRQLFMYCWRVLPDRLCALACALHVLIFCC